MSVLPFFYYWFVWSIQSYSRCLMSLVSSSFFFFSSRRRHTRSDRDWSSDVCSSDLELPEPGCFIQAQVGDTPVIGFVTQHDDRRIAHLRLDEAAGLRQLELHAEEMPGRPAKDAFLFELVGRGIREHRVWRSRHPFGGPLHGENTIRPA